MIYQYDPIISNINIALYQLTKCLAKLFSSLSTSEYTAKSTRDFITHIKGQNKECVLQLTSGYVSHKKLNVLCRKYLF